MASAIELLLNEASRIRRYDLQEDIPEDLLPIKREVLQRRVLELRGKYGPQLTETPEAKYLEALVEFYDPVSKREQDPNLYLQVRHLTLSTRSRNTLKWYDIDYVGELVQKSEKELLETRNFGKKSLDEIKKSLETMGLRLGMRLDHFVKPAGPLVEIS